MVISKYLENSRCDVNLTINLKPLKPATSCLKEWYIMFFQAFSIGNIKLKQAFINGCFRFHGDPYYKKSRYPIDYPSRYMFATKFSSKIHQKKINETQKKHNESKKQNSRHGGPHHCLPGPPQLSRVRGRRRRSRGSRSLTGVGFFRK